MNRDREIETVSGQEAVDIISSIWREYRAGEPPIEQVNVILDEEGGRPAKWEEGVVTVAREMNKGRYGTSKFENLLFEQLDEAHEDTIQKELEAQEEILEERFRFLDDFELHYEGVQVADLENKGGHHGREAQKWMQVNNGSDYIVLDYSYLPFIDPIDDNVEPTAERVIRHEAVHALQRALDNGFRDVWKSTGSLDIGRATTEGMARYEQFKGTNIEREVEKAARDPWKVPEFWRENIAEDNASPTNPYSYGELAAYFLEERFNENYEGIDRSQEEVRNIMLENPSKEELDRQLSEASGMIGVDWYGEYIEEQIERLTEGGELKYDSFKRWAPYERRGLDKVMSKHGKQRNDLTDLSKWYKASAADAVYREFSDEEIREGEELQETVRKLEASLESTKESSGNRTAA